MGRIIKSAQEEYDIVYGKEKDKWEFVRLEWAPYNDIKVYRNKETGEEVEIYYYIGD